MELVREEPPNPKEGIKAPLDENLRKASKQQIQEEEEDPPTGSTSDSGKSCRVGGCRMETEG